MARDKWLVRPDDPPGARCRRLRPQLRPRSRTHIGLLGELTTSHATTSSSTTTRSASCSPRSARLDLGGIGKGRAADLVAEELIDSGAATGGCVNLGGDLRVFGDAPERSPAWAVGLENPDDEEAVLLVVGLADGALATSSTTRRRWRTEDGSQHHHLIDPRTRAPADTDLVSVSVIAGSTMTAEIHAKASLIAGEPTDDALPMLFVRDDGSRAMFNDFEAYVW